MGNWRILRSLVIGLALGRTVPAQSITDQLLTRARAKITDLVARAPNFTCTETVSRVNYLPARKVDAGCTGREPLESDLVVKDRDRLRLDVGFSGTNEMFSWSGEKHFIEGSIAGLVGYGTIGSGMFSSFLGAIFRNTGGRFRFEKTYNEGGRVVSVFSFVMPREASTWEVQAGDQKAMVGYQGRFIVDTETADLLGLAIDANDVPRALGNCRIRINTQYHQVALGTSTFALPQRVKTITLPLAGGKHETETEYSGCHQFVGESTIHFEGEDASASAKPAAAVEPTDLPGGLTLRIRLSSHVDVESGWVGDPVEGVLEDPLVDSNHQVLAPKGARITGRLVRLELVEQPSQRIEVAFDWQRIDAGTRAYRVAAHRADSKEPGALHLLDSPLPADEELPSQTFTLKGDHPKLDEHFVSRWITESAHPVSRP